MFDPDQETPTARFDRLIADAQFGRPIADARGQRKPRPDKSYTFNRSTTTFKPNLRGNLAEPNKPARKKGTKTVNTTKSPKAPKAPRALKTRRPGTIGARLEEVVPLRELDDDDIISPTPEPVAARLEDDRRPSKVQKRNYVGSRR